MLEQINHLALIGSLMQQMCIYLVIAYLLSKTPLFAPLMQVTVRLPDKLVCYVVFSGFCIMGTYFGFQIEGAIANTRAIGAVLGGLLGGPVVGFLVGLTGGLHRYLLGGFTDSACAVSTTVEGLLGGCVHAWLLRHNQAARILQPTVALVTTLVAEALQMLIILLIAKPFDHAARLVAHIALPMILTNALGAALFMRLILDRRDTLERYSIAFSEKALRIAHRTVGILMQGFDEQNCTRMAKIIQEETGVGAVAITNCETILAFVGVGADHHRPGTRISSPHTFDAIARNEVVYADGAAIPYACALSRDCKLGSSLVIPLRGEGNRVFGTIKLYEPKTKFFSSLNRTLGEGIARLLSNQILAGTLEEQKRLLAQSEIKLLQAQINPHFLFNALNTLAAVIRSDPEEARRIVRYLSTFFRKSLKRPSTETHSRRRDRARRGLPAHRARAVRRPAAHRHRRARGTAVRAAARVHAAADRRERDQARHCADARAGGGHHPRDGQGRRTGDRGRGQRRALSGGAGGRRAGHEPGRPAGQDPLRPGLRRQRDLRARAVDAGRGAAAAGNGGRRMLSAVIVDDEAPSREELKALLAATGGVEVAAECANALEGLSAIHRLRPDVAFVDIQMPRVSGLEMVGMIDPAALPCIVFVTAYDEHALKAFEEHATDYLLKPIDPRRLARTLDWLKGGTRPTPRPPPGTDGGLHHIPCLARHRVVLLPLSEVEFVNSELSGVQVVCATRQGVTELTLKLLQERTPFVRCHRQYLVNLDQVREIELLDNGAAAIVTRSGKTVPVSRRFLREIKDTLFIA